MVCDHLSNATMYEGVAGRMRLAFEFLRKNPLEPIELGKHAIDGDNVFLLISEYETKPQDQVKWEAHRTYFDVQMLLSGIERIGYANIQSLNVVKEYDPVLDYLLLEGPGNDLIMTPGLFVIFGPQDAHRPNMAVDHPARVHKAVVKVRVDD